MKLAPFIYKESLHVVRDWRMLLVVIMIPIVQMLLFGFAISTEVNNIKVAVSYQKYTNDVRLTIERLIANPYVTVKKYVAPTDIYTTLKAGETDAAILFADGEEAQIITDASNPNMAQTSTGYLTAILSDSYAAPLLFDSHYLYNPQLLSSYNFVPGVMGMLFLLVCALMTAVSVVREKETGTMELLLVSPVRPMAIIISKMVPFFVLSCIDLTLIILIARYLLGVPLSGGVIPIVLFTTLYVVLSLFLGLFVSTVSRTQIMAMLICGMVMIFPVILLSGLIFPTENLPVVLKQLSYIVPARWYIDAMRKLMIEGLPLTDVMLALIILSGMTLFFLIVSLRNFKDRLS